MINYEKSGLLIFDNFQIDFNLPKWKERSRIVTPDDSLNPFPPAFPRMNRRNGYFVSSGVALMPIQGAIGGNGIISGSAPSTNDTDAKNPSLWDRIFHRKRIRKAQEGLAERMNRPNFTVELSQAKEPDSKMTVEEFFSSVKNSAEELVLAKERYENYEGAIQHLKKTGQLFLIEQMEQDLEIHAAETKLYAIGLRKVITEKNMADFAEQSPRALKLDWIQNFARLIPGKVIDVKVNADEKHIFDNYCVLHFDPDNKGSGKTKEELKNEKKDPILFGVIAGSNKLYYLADWIDEYCDLTFDKLVQTLGESAVSANDLTANVQIN